MMKFYKEASVRMKKAEHTTADADISYQNEILVGNFVDRERPSLIKSMDESLKAKLGDKYQGWPEPV
jgi:2-oxoglutarate/2-oxoacid ferredoxin oxidoreductase subunit beta